MMINDKLLPIGQGTGLSGRFAGLCDPFGSFDAAAIALLPVPFDKTSTYRKGSDKGPNALIEASRNLELYDIETDSQVYLKGIFTDESIVEETSLKMLKRTYERTKQLINAGKFVVSVGGEHSISFAPIRAHAEHYGPLTVLQFDAHADLQPAYENDPWSHASAMSRVKEIPQVTKVVSVGIRSMSVEELPFIDKANTFYAHEIDLQGEWIGRVINALTERVYITFDLDVFDCGLMPSTGTPEPGGLSWNQVMALLKQVAKTKKVVGIDVVELCPHEATHAPDFLAAKLIYKFLSYKFHFQS